MGFRESNFASLVKFNSEASSKFLNFYTDYVTNQLKSKGDSPKSRTFVPSSFRCERKCWFRLRGTELDIIQNPDVTLQFTAEVGTARHRIIQKNLVDALGVNWISVSDWLQDNPIPYKYKLEQHDLETLVSIDDPPVHFACDGIIKWNGKIYLLEIKTSEYSSWNALTDPKSTHIDQIKCYSTLLGIPDVLMLYEDRQYGGLKCYEVHVSSLESEEVLNKMRYIQHMAQCNLAPDRLDVGDYMCKSCEYQLKCKEWG